MRLNILENPNVKEIDIQIVCRAIDENVVRLERHIRLFDRVLTATRQNGCVMIPAKEVYYVESVDKCCYLYTESQVLKQNIGFMNWKKIWRSVALSGHQNRLLLTSNMFGL